MTPPQRTLFPCSQIALTGMSGWRASATWYNTCVATPLSVYPFSNAHVSMQSCTIAHACCQLMEVLARASTQMEVRLGLKHRCPQHTPHAPNQTEVLFAKIPRAHSPATRPQMGEHANVSSSNHCFSTYLDLTPWGNCSNEVTCSEAVASDPASSAPAPSFSSQTVDHAHCLNNLMFLNALLGLPLTNRCKRFGWFEILRFRCPCNG